MFSHSKRARVAAQACMYMPTNSLIHKGNANAMQMKNLNLVTLSHTIFKKGKQNENCSSQERKVNENCSSQENYD